MPHRAPRATLAVTEAPAVAQPRARPAWIISRGRRERHRASRPDHADVADSGGRAAVRPCRAEYRRLAEQPGGEHAGQAQRELECVTPRRPAVGIGVHQGDGVLWPVVRVGPGRRIVLVVARVPDEHRAADAPELARGERRPPHVGARPAVIGQHLIAHRPVPPERGGDGAAHQRPELKQAGTLARRRRVMLVHVIA